MADSVDRVFGHALNTVSKVRPGSQKPPDTDRLALYGLYKQSMEGDVTLIADRPTSSLPGSSGEELRKEQEKWDAWKSNEGITRTEAKRRYIEKLIETMHKYASGTNEAKELVEELEFVWDQIKHNSQHSSSERSSPLRTAEQSGYLGDSRSGEHAGPSSSAAALGGVGGRNAGMTMLRPVSEPDDDEDDGIMGRDDEDGDEFVDARVSQFDPTELRPSPSDANAGASPAAANDGVHARSAAGPPQQQAGDKHWRKRIEFTLTRLTTEVAALREQLENRGFAERQRRHSLLGWIWRLGWWAVQLIVANAVILWVVILYMRRRHDRRLEMAVRVLLGDAVAQMQKVASKEVKLPSLPRMSGRKANH